MEEFRECNDVQERSKYKHTRTIIHIDMDCFYAQVEMLKNPDLASKPVGIKQQHYVITSNYVAREYGIKKAMMITEALALCPKLIIVNGEDLHDYRLMSAKVTDVIKQFTSKVEKLGLDENFVDVTDIVSSRLSSKTYNGSSVIGHVYRNEIENMCTCGCKERLILGSCIASEIRERLREELRMTSCAGIGHNKLLAKLVGPTHKPNQQTTVFPCSANALVSSLYSVKKIPGIGRKTMDILEALNMCSVADVQNASVNMLEKHFDKSFALWIKGVCFGVDDTDVKESGKQQVIGLEEASKKISTMEDVCNRLRSLITRSLVLLQEDGRYPSTLRVTVRKYSPREYTRQRESKQCPINSSVIRTANVEEQIFNIALGLFKKLVDHTQPFHLTLIGLAYNKFQEEVPAKSSLLQFINKSFEKKSNEKLMGNCEKDTIRSNKFTNMYDSENNRSSNKSAPFNEIDESVLNELPEDIRSEILENYTCKVSTPSTSSTAHKSQSMVHCPVGVDQNVFNELPFDIQMELINNNNVKNCGKTALLKSGSTSKKQKSILNYVRKKPDM